MNPFIPAELTARMAELCPESFGVFPTAAPPFSDPNHQARPATCEESAPPPPDSSPPNTEPRPQDQVAAAPHSASFAEFTPPFIGATNLRRYRLRWDNFRRCWTRPAPQEPEADLIDGISD